MLGSSDRKPHLEEKSKVNFLSNMGASKILDSKKAIIRDIEIIKDGKPVGEGEEGEQRHALAVGGYGQQSSEQHRECLPVAIPVQNRSSITVPKRPTGAEPGSRAAGAGSIPPRRRRVAGNQRRPWRGGNACARGGDNPRPARTGAGGPDAAGTLRGPSPGVA